MVDAILSICCHFVGRVPCFRIWGKGRRERAWRQICVYASHRHNMESRWPLLRGTCVTLTSEVLVVGWDFARDLIDEQFDTPASRAYPIEVGGGRLHDLQRREQAGASVFPTNSEVLAHECGHTWQALWYRAAYLPFVATVTLFQEGPHSWNHFENQASEQGLFGGIISGTVCSQLIPYLNQYHEDR